MQVPKFHCLATALFILATPLFGLTQTLTADEKSAAIQTIAKHIATNYVFPDKGGQISSHILTANHRGDFAKAQNWKEFDDMVTASLRKFSGDGHLYVRHDPEQVMRIKKAATEDNTMNIGDAGDADNNYGVGESKVLPQNIGYIKLSEINISEKSLPVLYEAMQKVENTDALVIDLRDNGGGGSPVGAVLESYFLPENTPLLDFTTRNGVLKTDSTINWLKEKKYTKPVYIIVNKNTASAAEAFAFVLQQNKRAKIVGEATAGAAYRNEWFVVNDENYISVSTASPNLAGTDITWEGNGVQPDMKVKKDDPLDFLLKKISAG